ncbi:MAG: hypothetical protein JSU04_15785 [Bdellovibrionales bacterium]|nr:hypothetical protein [Bdellovibrionales bacterium]
MWSFFILLFTAGLAQASSLNDHFKLEYSAQAQGVEIRIFAGTEREVYYQPAIASPTSLIEFRKEVRARIDTDPVVLLKKQKEVFANAGAKDYLPRFDRVLSQKLFTVSFLEEMLLDLHSEILGKPLFGSYSEFGASVLIGPDREMVVIFLSNPSEAMVPANTVREEWLKKYLARGYHFKIHIHNHPFNFSNPQDIGGTPIPSGFELWGDAGAYRSEKQRFLLENAWITNGFNTLRIPAVDFDKY